jgi:hypothetical protein
MVLLKHFVLNQDPEFTGVRIRLKDFLINKKGVVEVS